MTTIIPQGVCATAIHIDVQDGRIVSVAFDDGCTGNLAALSILLTGMKTDEAIAKLEGIQCQNGTSCPDQLAKALLELRSAV